MSNYPRNLRYAVNRLNGYNTNIFKLQTQNQTTASNGHGDGYSYWEGGVLPSTRTVSFNVNVKF